MAPMSAPSLTAMPTLRPASITRSQRRGEEVSARAARAKKQQPMVIACEATPQQAAEKKLELSAAASPARAHAAGCSRSCRKKHHAPPDRLEQQAQAVAEIGRGAALTEPGGVEVLPRPGESLRQPVALGHQPAQRPVVGEQGAARQQRAVKQPCQYRQQQQRKQHPKREPTNPGQFHLDQPAGRNCAPVSCGWGFH